MQNETDVVPEPSEVKQHEQVHKAETAHRAIQKYVVDDYLQKAGEDGKIPENFDKYPKTLGIQFNIQGIEKDIQGTEGGFPF